MTGREIWKVTNKRNGEIESKPEREPDKWSQIKRARSRVRKSARKGVRLRVQEKGSQMNGVKEQETGSLLAAPAKAVPQLDAKAAVSRRQWSIISTCTAF